MQDTNRNSETVGSDPQEQNESESQPAWAPPQASHNAFFDDQRTVYQRMTHEAQTSPEDDVDDVFTSPLEAADEHPTTQLDLQGAEAPTPPATSSSSGDDQTTQLTPSDWAAIAAEGGQPDAYAPPGTALSDLHDEGLGATMHGSQAFASFPAQEDSQETTMLPPTPEAEAGAGSTQTENSTDVDQPEVTEPTQAQETPSTGEASPAEDPDNAATTMLTPEYAQQYAELSEQATQMVDPGTVQPGGGAPQPDQGYQHQEQPLSDQQFSQQQYQDYQPSDQQFLSHQSQDQQYQAQQPGSQPDYYASQSAPAQPYQNQGYGDQQGWDEQATYMQQPSEPFYPDQQSYQPAAQPPGYPQYEPEQPMYPAGYSTQQTPFDPSHGATSRGATGYPQYGESAQNVEPHTGYLTPEPQYYPPDHPHTEPQFRTPEPPPTAPDQQYPPVAEPERPQSTYAAQPEPIIATPVAQPGIETEHSQSLVPPAGSMQFGSQASAYSVPQNIPGRFVPTAEEFAARRAHKPQTPEATMGLPGLVKRLTFGIFAPPMSKKEEEHREYVTTVRRNFGGLRQITVVNPKGGAGKTVASLMTAMTFGQNRGGYVLAWDNNETQGTLGMRAQPDFHAHTVRDVLQSLDTFLAASGKVGDLSSFVRSQGEAMFDVLASDESATAGEMLTASAFKHIREVVSRFYKLIIVDTGNNVRAENWQAAIDQTDQLMITMSARGDSAETAARMLDHLEQTGRSSLVRHAVTVVSMPPSRRGLDLPAIERHFSARTRAVLIAPYEPIIDSGEPIRYENISTASKEAWLRIASGVAEGL